MFAIIALLLTVITIIELDNQYCNWRSLFNICLFILSALLCLRYGQGTDYYGYFLQFEHLNKSSSFFTNTLYHGEYGWYVLLLFFKKLGASFDIFVIFISLVMMLSVKRAITLFSPNYITSLLVFYPTYYLTYCYSAMRQGLVMTVFLGFGLELLIEKKHIKYYLLSFVLVLFHSSAIILFILPIMVHFRDRKMEKYFLIAVGTSVVFGYTGLLDRIASRFGLVAYFSVSISIGAILLRLIFFLIIFEMRQNSKCISNECVDTLYILYLTGFILYIVFAFSSNLSQRLTMPLKAIEIVLLPILISATIEQNENPKMATIKFAKKGFPVVVLCCILVLNVETIKNIYSYIDQGNYYSWVNPLTYPYSSIFDKDIIHQYITHFDEEIA